MALGAILVSQGILSDERLDEVRAEQARTGERLEQTVARLGIASAEQAMRAVADELALPFLRLDETEIDEEAVRLVPPRVVFRLRALPVRREGSRLLVATSDPLRLDGFEQLRLAAGMPIALAVAEDGDLGSQIRARFGVAGDVLEALGAGEAPTDARAEAGDAAEGDDASEASVVRLVNDLLFEAI
ncbi:MAG: Type secretion system protein, partial [Planctomycetota bacterium]